MTPVPQAAVDALRAAENAHIFEPYEGRCRCGFRGRYSEQSQHRDEAVAAAVVAAVQGPIKAEALRAEAENWRAPKYRGLSFSGALVAVNLDAAADNYADRIEAQP